MGHQQAAQEIQQFEQLAEAAYAAMYEAMPAMAKACHEDACSHLAQAIAAAERAGLEKEVARLAARRDQISEIYNRQFRGIGY